MRKLMFSLLFLLLSAISFAQTEKGSWLLGGSGLIGKSFLNNRNLTSISIQPSN